MKRILVIEDEPQVRSNIKEILELADFDAMVSENGQQGLQLAKDKIPDLIICDLMMPELDGYTVLTQLRQDSNTAAIPLIFLTAKSEWSDLRKGMELGADDYLTKPFQPHELLQAITTQLSKQAIAKQQTEEKLDDLRSCISRSLPHEINTPLNQILGMSTLLMQDCDAFTDPESLEMVESIHRAALRLHRMTVNFLMYADLELLASNPQKIELLRNSKIKYSVKSVIQDMALEIANNTNRISDLQLDVAEGIVNISPLKLNKIVEEIVDNAFKFSSPTTLVKVIGLNKDNAYHLYVIDHGRGMTSEQITNVGAYVQFERKMYEQQGSGLGLTIAKRITELHGGTFSIESLLNYQTMIRVVLPQ